MTKLFTVEFDKKHEKVEIHLNSLGVDMLIGHLEALKKHGVTENVHLMTEDWGGNELTNERQNSDDNIQLINHLKVFYWAD
jgi:hypothetical protein